MAETSLVRHARVVGGAREHLAADLAREYAAAASIRELAARIGRSYGFVHRVLSEAGVLLRSRGGNTRGSGNDAS